MIGLEVTNLRPIAKGMHLHWQACMLDYKHQPLDRKIIMESENRKISTNDVRILCDIHKLAGTIEDEDAREEVSKTVSALVHEATS